MQTKTDTNCYVVPLNRTETVEPSKIKTLPNRDIKVSDFISYSITFNLSDWREKHIVKVRSFLFSFVLALCYYHCNNQSRLSISIDNVEIEKVTPNILACVLHGWNRYTIHNYTGALDRARWVARGHILSECGDAAGRQRCFTPTHSVSFSNWGSAASAFSK